jgi:hypothetical protein
MTFWPPSGVLAGAMVWRLDAPVSFSFFDTSSLNAFRHTWEMLMRSAFAFSRKTEGITTFMISDIF